MPYEEEEDRVCEVKCPKGGGVCGIGSTPILLPKFNTQEYQHCENAQQEEEEGVRRIHSLALFLA